MVAVLIVKLFALKCLVSFVEVRISRGEIFNCGASVVAMCYLFNLVN